MTKSPKTGRELEEQRVQNGPSVFARIVRSLSGDDDESSE